VRLYDLNSTFTELQTQILTFCTAYTYVQNMDSDQYAETLFPESAKMGSAGKVVELNAGTKIPLVGLGTAAINQNPEEIKTAVATALEVNSVFIILDYYWYLYREVRCILQPAQIK
jgi:hypothetical protein